MALGDFEYCQNAAPGSVNGIIRTNKGTIWIGRRDTWQSYNIYWGDSYYTNELGQMEKLSLCYNIPPRSHAGELANKYCEDDCYGYDTCKIWQSSVDSSSALIMAPRNLRECDNYYGLRLTIPETFPSVVESSHLDVGRYERSSPLNAPLYYDSRQSFHTDTEYGCRPTSFYRFFNGSLPIFSSNGEKINGHFGVSCLCPSTPPMCGHAGFNGYIYHEPCQSYKFLFETMLFHEYESIDDPTATCCEGGYMLGKWYTIAGTYTDDTKYQSTSYNLTSSPINEPRLTDVCVPLCNTQIMCCPGVLWPVRDQSIQTRTDTRTENHSTFAAESRSTVEVGFYGCVYGHGYSSSFGPSYTKGSYSMRGDYLMDRSNPNKIIESSQTNNYCSWTVSNPLYDDTLKYCFYSYSTFQEDGGFSEDAGWEGVVYGYYNEHITWTGKDKIIIKNQYLNAYNYEKTISANYSYIYSSDPYTNITTLSMSMVEHFYAFSGGGPYDYGSTPDSDYICFCLQDVTNYTNYTGADCQSDSYQVTSAFSNLIIGRPSSPHEPDKFKGYGFGRMYFDNDDPIPSQYASPCFGKAPPLWYT